MTRNPICIGIDIGGTKIGIGLVDDEGHVIDKVRMSSTADPSCRGTVALIARQIGGLLHKHSVRLEDIRFTGVTIPGTVNMETGVAEFVPNLHWYDEPIAQYFKEILGVDVLVMQDVRAAAVAELLYGAGKQWDDFVCVVLGTGVACGIVINRKVFHGGLNTAGELGDTVIEANGRPCNCGNFGCLERYCSGIGIIELALERFPEKLEGKPQTTEAVFRLAEEGDGDARALIQESVNRLAMGIASVVNILSPQAVIVSGGMSDNEFLMLQPLQELLNRYAYRKWVERNPQGLHKSTLSGDAPMIGAAALYKVM